MSGANHLEFMIRQVFKIAIRVVVIVKTTWILVWQEVHTLGIGTGNARASRTGPGPNIP